MAQRQQSSWPRVANILKALNWRTIISLISLVILIFFLISRFDQIQRSLQTAVTSNGLWLVAALVSLAGTYLTASAAYYATCRAQLPYIGLLKVEIASGFASRLLPANVGGLALNARYINVHLKNRTKSVGLVALNNVLGFIAYLISALVLVAILHKPFAEVFRFHIPLWIWLVGASIVLGMCISMLASHYIRQKIGVWWHDLVEVLTGFKKSPKYLGYNFIAYTLTTFLYVFSFYACVRAVGAPVSFIQAFGAFTLGLTAGSVTPTPGGLIGVEVGLYTGLFAAGILPSLALSAVLVYRLMAYWLPVIPGFFMFRHLLKQKII